MGESLPDSLDELLLGDPSEVFGQDIKSKHLSESVPEKSEYGESESPDSKDNVAKVKQEDLDVKTERLCKYCNFSGPKRALMKQMRTHIEKNCRIANDQRIVQGSRRLDTQTCVTRLFRGTCWCRPAADEKWQALIAHTHQIS